ncbi:zinc finger protein 384-like isoform X1 [Myxocyprinus asiaticus]|uniref:zinc finger protein 384-like isoform X1 n=1 Tax=Myxocyprinus asiaticus TaxID=70543 RepID=UPI002221CEA6|nr:zinc finger protein 384-like isoform X1 [Myxocyprinus asiaticus]
MTSGCRGGARFVRAEVLCRQFGQLRKKEKNRKKKKKKRMKKKTHYISSIWGFRKYFTNYPDLRKSPVEEDKVFGAGVMEDSHFNSYFWSPVQGQIENAVFLNKVKEQLGHDKSPTYSHGPAHYPATAVVAFAGGAMDTTVGGRTLKQEQAQASQASHSITVVPVPSTGIMTAAGLVTLVSPVSSAQSLIPGHPSTTMITVQTDKNNESVPCSPVIVPLPSKRGRKKKSTLPFVGSPTGIDPLILGLAGQHHSANPFSLSPEEVCTGKEGGKTYRCRMCGLTFCSKSDMQLHSKLHTEVKAHQCPHCSKSFANTSYLAQHIRIHSGAKPYSCFYCQKAFRQLSHLQQHTRIHTESKPHKCPHCTKSFSNTSYLAQHVRIHTGVKPYTCNFCQKTFRQLSHLQQHHRIHTGDRPYKCTQPGCEKSFTQLSNLRSHRRQHNKDKPYKCHYCNRGYVDASSLEVHLSTHTVKHAKLYSCGLCNHNYTSEMYLMKHMHKHAPDVVLAPPGSDNPGHAGGGGSGGDRAERSNTFTQQAVVPCIFDLNQYKPVTSADVQYKTVSVSDISPHKDLCITVEASAIQVEHLNS